MTDPNNTSRAPHSTPGDHSAAMRENASASDRTNNGDFSEDKILIVDDTPANLDLLRDMLKPLGTQIFFATSGTTALEIAASAKPDLILMDIMMPGMDGLETCRRLKAASDLQTIPVIFVTAKIEVGDLVQGFEAGGVDYITKPVKQPEVHARVVAHLRIQGLIRQQRENLKALDLARKELQELNATKDKFLSSVGRTLTDSLREISLASRSLKPHPNAHRKTEENLSSKITGLNESADRMLGLLENILEWPRVQTGQKLDLLDMEIGDRELGYLVEALDNLRFLSLAGTRITDAGLEHVEALKGLRELHLDGTAVTDNGLALIGRLTGLEVLDLKDTSITNATLALLKPLHNLKGLYLTRTLITDDGLAHLAGHSQLRTLILWDTQITDQGLEHLQSLLNLREVILWGSRVTPQGAERLREKLPDCDVSLDMFA